MQRSGDGARRHVQRGSSRTEQAIDVRFVIGADGTRSAVAKGMGAGPDE